MATISPFRVEISDEALDDLKARIANSRLPDAVVDNGGWSQGIDRDHLIALLRYWHDTFDWREQESAINTLRHFVMEHAEGHLHFVHEMSARPGAVPILMLHGWPGCFWEFRHIIPMLTGGDGASQAFHVVAPSLPGFGFSSKYTKERYTVRDMAIVIKMLMSELGYERFYLQAGDWGSAVARSIALMFPGSVIGLHLNLSFAEVPKSLWYLPKRILFNIMPRLVLSGMYHLRIVPSVCVSLMSIYAAEEIEHIKMYEYWQEKETGYAAIQGTKPFTIGVGLNDSPVGLLAWIGDKMRLKDKDDLLTVVSIYWFTETIASSFRIYKENLLPEIPLPRVIVPSAIAIFPKEISKPPREWLTYYYNLYQYTKMPRGGHFAALQEPALLAEDVRNFVKKVGKSSRL
ncbi:epoxide hydrolase [Irineochytrium annulatum]|nr:epoxide hydrolase [Irineochytrium annulatum]